MYCVLSFRVTCLFAFDCSCVDAMCGGLKGINHDKRKYDTSLNSCKGPPLLEEAWKPAAVSSVVSDNADIECKNEIVTDTDDSNDGSVKLSPPSGM